MDVYIKVSKKGLANLLGMRLVERTIFELSLCGLKDITLVPSEGIALDVLKKIRLPKGVNINIANEIPQNVLVVDSSYVLKQKILCELIEKAKQGTSYLCKGQIVIQAPNQKNTEELQKDMCIEFDFENESKVKWFMLKGLRKPLLIDGLVGYFIMRPITLRLTAVLSNTFITPNMVSFFCLILALGAAFLAGGAHNLYLVQAAAVLYFIAATLDCVDGELSRLKYLGSKFGAWMDTIVDDTSTMAFNLGLAVYAARSRDSQWWLYFAIVASVAFVLTQGYVYYYLATKYHSGDLMDFKWSFQKEGSEGTSIVDYLVLLVKRDFVAAMLLVLIIFNLVHIATFIVSLSMLVYLIVAIVDYRFRKNRSNE